MIHLNSHLVSMGIIHNNTHFEAKRLKVTFISESTMQEILIRIENKENLDIFKSIEFFKNQLKY